MVRDAGEVHVLGIKILGMALHGLYIGMQHAFIMLLYSLSLDRQTSKPMNLPPSLLDKMPFCRHKW